MVDLVVHLMLNFNDVLDGQLDNALNDGLDGALDLVFYGALNGSLDDALDE